VVYFFWALCICFVKSHCSDWSTCSSNVESDGCTFYDIVTDVLQYPSWSWANTFDVEQRRYLEAIDALRHLCSNTQPGIGPFDGLTYTDTGLNILSVMLRVMSLKIQKNQQRQTDRQLCRTTEYRLLQIFAIFKMSCHHELSYKLQLLHSFKH